MMQLSGRQFDQNWVEFPTIKVNQIIKKNKQ